MSPVADGSWTIGSSFGLSLPENDAWLFWTGGGTAGRLFKAGWAEVLLEDFSGILIETSFEVEGVEIGLGAGLIGNCFVDEAAKPF